MTRESSIGPSAREDRVSGRLWRKYREFRALSAVLYQRGQRSRVLAGDSVDERLRQIANLEGNAALDHRISPPN
jgi:hypothetical protein